MSDNTVWIEYSDGRKTEYEASAFTIEDGCIVLWSETHRLCAVHRGEWARVAANDWLVRNGGYQYD